MDYEERKVLKKIKMGELISLARDLVKIPSINPPGNEKQVAELIYSRMERAGFDVEIEEVLPDRPNVVATLHGRVGEPTLLFHAHTDVIPPDGKWSNNPFGAELVDGKIYGRGIADMKGSLAAMIVAMEALKESGIELAGTLKLAAVIDEERFSTGTRHLVKKGLKADYAIFGEPTDFKIGVAQKGWALFIFTTHGKRAHASVPHEGINAIVKMARLIQRLQEYGCEIKKRKHHLLGYPTISIGVVEGGLKYNIIPFKCLIEVDRRLIPGETPESALKEFEQIIRELMDEDSDFEADVKMMEEAIGAVETPTNRPLVKEVEYCINKIINRKPEICGLTYTSDAAYIGDVSSIICGPGDVSTAHKVNEHLHVDRLLDAARIYAAAALRLLNK